MSFEIARTKFKSRPSAQYPAAVSYKANGPGEPRLYITISRQLATQAKVVSRATYDLMVGTGKDKGKVALIQSETGECKPRMNRCGSYLFYCGYIEQLGPVEIEFTRCEAVISGDGDMVITLPAAQKQQRTPELKLIKAAGM